MTRQPKEIHDPTYVSLLIFVHLFCVVAVLSSNFAPSSLQQDLVTTLAPYTKTVHLDPNFVPYHLTTGEGTSRLHQWLVTSDDGVISRYPESEWAGGFGLRRWDMLAMVGSHYASSDTDEIPADFAKGFVRNTLHRRGSAARSNERFLVQCVRHLGSTSPAATDPDKYAAQNVHITYEADVWFNEDGELAVLKRSPRFKVATPVVENTSDSDVRGPNVK